MIPHNWTGPISYRPHRPLPKQNNRDLRYNSQLYSQQRSSLSCSSSNCSCSVSDPTSLPCSRKHSPYTGCSTATTTSTQSNISWPQPALVLYWTSSTSACSC
jgi:hypothetical protein